MTENALVVSHAGKAYATYSSDLARFARWVGFPTHPQSEFHAVRDATFSIRPGETVAIVGQNGAGKSTLLKMITGTVRPTSGSVVAHGRVNAILELGLGFNMEFTGRENVRQSGGLLGYSSAEVEKLMPEIEAFAELGEYFDNPLRTYSTGMQARLAFSLVTAVRPDILIVDEVLSVGDSYFQHKSFDRIRKFRDEGVTILLVTHSMGDVKELCDRVILLDKGTILKDGPPDEVVDYYNAMIAEKENAKLSIEQRRQKNGWMHTEFGNGLAKVETIDLYEAGGTQPIAVARVGAELEVRSRIRAKQDLPELVIGHRITDRTGHIVWGSNLWHSRQVLRDMRAGETIDCVLRFPCMLGPGSYSISFGLHTKDTHLEECFHRADNQIVFDVMNADKPTFIGTTYLDASFDVQLGSTR
jgi:lipopolysaccharide transport system ATP-binding protein